VFLSIYYQRYLRPLKDILVANVEAIAPISAKIPLIHNAVVKMKPVQRFLETYVGYKDTPLLSYPTLKTRVENTLESFDLKRIKTMSDGERKKCVAIVQDPFTSFYDASSVEKLISVIQKLGYKPLLVPFIPNGKPAHVKGFLNKFEKQATKAAMFLNELQALDITMVGVDASLVLCYRDEYSKLLKDKRGDFMVHTIDEWLASLTAEVAANSIKEEAVCHFTLLAHCSEKTALPESTKRWQAIFDALGTTLTVMPTGCCGMAGTFGHEASNFDSSKALYDLSWESAVKESKALGEVLVTGFSCRSQVARFEGEKPRHPIEVVEQLIQL
jgi:Fe-S oxidoreductase